MLKELPENKEIEIKRNHCVGEIQRLQTWLGNNKFHPRRNYYVKELDKYLKQLREINAINKEKGQTQEALFGRVVKDCISKEQYKKVLVEVESRLAGNEPKIISILRESDEEVLEKYPELLKEHSQMINKIKTLSKEMDDLMLSTKGSHSPEQWDNIQNFNKNIIRVKRELQNLIS